MNMAEPQNLKRIYTTASQSMDIRGTIVVNPKAGFTVTGRQIRTVDIPEDIFHKQVNIYISNLYAVMDEDEWRTELQFGNVSTVKKNQVSMDRYSFVR